MVLWERWGCGRSLCGIIARLVLLDPLWDVELDEGGVLFVEREVLGGGGEGGGERGLDGGGAGGGDAVVGGDGLQHRGRRPEERFHHELLELRDMGGWR